MNFLTTGTEADNKNEPGNFFSQGCCHMPGTKTLNEIRSFMDGMGIPGRDLWNLPFSSPEIGWILKLDKRRP